ncbi:MAG: hypothetical protein Q8Q56_02325 [Alphaproteobacteria bacterium]|nr:hypothetical protein [Alphaproteobacteria bacterium]
MKKLILSSVFAGLVLAGSAVEASTAAAPQKAPYGNFVINADMGAGYWANLFHRPSGKAEWDKRSEDWSRNSLIAVHDSKMSFTTEGGCGCVAFGAKVKMNMDPSREVKGLFRDVYVFGRFSDIIEVRIGNQRDAMYSLVDADSVMGGAGGYNGYWSALLKHTGYKNAVRKDVWMLGVTHANDTGYTNALEVRTTRMAGFQGVLNFKPSEAHVGGLGTYKTGDEVIGKQNNLVSLGINYDNTFGDFRIRASAGGVYGFAQLTEKAKDAEGKETGKVVAIADQPDSFTYRVGGIFSWKDLDIGLGWLDNRSTGQAPGVKSKETNAGKVIHAGVGYQFSSVAMKPRIAVGGLWGWCNGQNDETTDNELKNQDQTLAISATFDLNIRDGFKWFVDGTWAALDASNKKTVNDTNYDEYNIIVGTGLAVSQ